MTEIEIKHIYINVYNDYCKLCDAYASVNKRPKKVQDHIDLKIEEMRFMERVYKRVLAKRTYHEK